ncbi:MAG: hypothetical protein LBU35_00425, partial [Holosporales bacterium]|nr:hypothetical protein [Holosporales bacterium]
DSLAALRALIVDAATPQYGLDALQPADITDIVGLLGLTQGDDANESYARMAIALLSRDGTTESGDLMAGGRAIQGQARDAALQLIADRIGARRAEIAAALPFGAAAAPAAGAHGAWGMSVFDCVRMAAEHVQDIVDARGRGELGQHGWNPANNERLIIELASSHEGIGGDPQELLRALRGLLQGAQQQPQAGVAPALHGQQQGYHPGAIQAPWAAQAQHAPGRNRVTIRIDGANGNLSFERFV